MIQKILVIAGIIFFIYSIYSCKKIVSSLKIENLRKYWIVLTLLIILFLFGYILYLYFKIVNPIEMKYLHTLIETIFFFGALFVLVISKTSLTTINRLNKYSISLLKSKDQLEKYSKELQAKVEEHEKFNRLSVGRELRMIELKKRIKELEDKLNK